MCAAPSHARPPSRQVTKTPSVAGEALRKSRKSEFFVCAGTTEGGFTDLTNVPPPFAVDREKASGFADLSNWLSSVGEALSSIRVPSALEVLDDRRLWSKVAIVTGASSGLGEETARTLCKGGARVIMACRDIASGTAAKKRILSSLEQSAGKSEERAHVTHTQGWVGVDVEHMGTLEVMELDVADMVSVQVQRTPCAAASVCRCPGSGWPAVLPNPS